MPIGFKFVWTEDDLPTGGYATVFDDHSDIVMLCHRPTFRRDPEAFMDYLEDHMGVQIDARSRLIQLRIAG